jgi:hypothetical protein
VADAVWPGLAGLRAPLRHPHGQRAPPRPGGRQRVLRSRRLFAILFGAKSSTPADQKAASRKKAETTLARIRRGADFGQLATQLSEDPGSRADSGYLPPGPRGRFVPAFDSAAWALGPGETSSLVETPFGYHIIKRPPLRDVRPRIDDYLAQRAGARLDSMYMDSLATAANIQVAKGAPATIRAALENAESSRESASAITTFDGGSLTVRELLRWVRALPPQYTAQLRTADDSTLIRFARVLTQNVLLLRQADSAGTTITSDEWADLRQRTWSARHAQERDGLTDGGVAARRRRPAAGRGGGDEGGQYADQLVRMAHAALPSAWQRCFGRRCPTGSTMPASAVRWSWHRR